MTSKTLIANWVEERQCALFEAGNRNKDGSLTTKLHREGHQGILSTSLTEPIWGSTTVKDSFPPPAPPSIRTTGKKQEMLRQQLYDMVSSQVREEFNPPPPPMDYTSTTKKDFTTEFTPTKTPPTMDHDVNSEQPVSYWTENIGAVTGVTQTCSTKSPFLKNTAFSKPIEEYLDETKPHDINKYSF